MKTIHTIKSSFFYSVILSLALLSITSCMNNQKREDSKNIAEGKNDQKFDNNHKKEKDAQFLVNAAEINLEEITLGQFAQSNSMTPEVKEMGKMIEADHTKALLSLKELAQKKSVTLPVSLTDDNKDAYKDLSNKSGDDFDKEYCDKMIDGHKNAIKEFEKAVVESEDTEIKAWAAATLPALRSHLEHALTCKDIVEKK